MPTAWAQPETTAQLYLDLLLAFAGYFAALACLALLLHLVFLWRECAMPSQPGRRPVLATRKKASSGHAKITIFPIARRAADLELAGSVDDGRFARTQHLPVVEAP